MKINSIEDVCSFWGVDEYEKIARPFGSGSLWVHLRGVIGNGPGMNKFLVFPDHPDPRKTQETFRLQEIVVGLEKDGQSRAQSFFTPFDGQEVEIWLREWGVENAMEIKRGKDGRLTGV